jgi:hypothetical protein
MEDLTIGVKAIQDSETKRTNITIVFPKEQGKMHVSDAAHLLIAGVCVLIKSCKKADTGIKDFELLKNVMKHLEEEFLDDFNDAFINKTYFDTGEKEKLE